MPSHDGGVIPLLDAAADLLLGASCPGCASPGWGVCVTCREALSGPVRRVDRGLDVATVASCHYRPILNHVVPRYKDDGAIHLARDLGDLLARAVADLRPPAGALLVPVPSLARVVRARGFDHAGRLATVAARRTGLRAGRRVLTRSDGGLDQRGLTRDQRARNLHGSMTARNPGVPVVIVDDIATTGASLREALRALRAADVVVLGAAVVADADKPVGSLGDSAPGV